MKGNPFAGPLAAIREAGIRKALVNLRAYLNLTSRQTLMHVHIISDAMDSSLPEIEIGQNSTDPTARISQPLYERHENRCDLALKMSFRHPWAMAVKAVVV